MLVLQGKDPSPMADLQQRASKQHNATCLRYLVMTPSPDLNLACDTMHGRVVERDLHVEDVVPLWEKMKREKKAEYDRKEESGEESNMADDQGEHHGNNTIRLHVISALEPASFPVLGMRDCYIRPLGLSNGGYVSRQMVCSLLGVCDEQGKVHVHRKKEYGEVYVHLEPVHEDRLPRLEHDVHFEVVGNLHDGGIVTKAFAVEPSHRTKRQSAYSDYSIDEEYCMPDYSQFPYNGCQVGCGPLAWAQIFGYYDMRAHAGLGDADGAALFRCGEDGTTGNDSCEAPLRNTGRMSNYISKLNDILETFCLGDVGATWQGNMERVEGFFRQRQGSSADITVKANSFSLFRLVMAYRDSIRNDALSFIRQKWPVVVGIKANGGVLSQHYAVMTKYRTRTVRTRECTLFVFCRTKIVREYDMFLHMGWGGVSNGWRKAEMAFAAVAKY
ncbi:hypothetical protein V1264_011485 [Littorina saxatilis]